jgi:hypothetical protein
MPEQTNRFVGYSPRDSPQTGAILESAAAEILRQEMTMTLALISRALNMGAKTHLSRLHHSRGKERTSANDEWHDTKSPFMGVPCPYLPLDLSLAQLRGAPREGTRPTRDLSGLTRKEGAYVRETIQCK